MESNGYSINLPAEIKKSIIACNLNWKKVYKVLIARTMAKTKLWIMASPDIFPLILLEVLPVLSVV